MRCLTPPMFFVAPLNMVTLGAMCPNLPPNSNLHHVVDPRTPSQYQMATHARSSPVPSLWISLGRWHDQKTDCRILTAVLYCHIMVFVRGFVSS